MLVVAAVTAALTARSKLQYLPLAVIMTRFNTDASATPAGPYRRLVNCADAVRPQARLCAPVVGAAAISLRTHQLVHHRRRCAAKTCASGLRHFDRGLKVGLRAR
jgi:hypothetical protein